MKTVVFEEICPACHAVNEVSAVKREDGFNDEETFYCALCGCEIGATTAAEPPKTKIIADAGAPAGEEMI